MRIGFVPILNPDDFAKACEWAVSHGAPRPRTGFATWWVKRLDGDIIGVLQRATVPTIGLALDPQGTARDTVAILDALRHASEFDGETPLILAQEGSVMTELRERLFENAGDDLRVYWMKKAR